MNKKLNLKAKKDLKYASGNECAKHRTKLLSRLHAVNSSPNIAPSVDWGTPKEGVASRGVVRMKRRSE